MIQHTRWQRLRTQAYLFVVGVKRHMTLGTRVMMIDGERVYLIRHTYLPGWQFPGGGVEPGESCEVSAAREVAEESGYRIAGPMQLFGLYHNVHAATNRDHVALYLCRQFVDSRVFQANLEIAEFGWFAVSDLPDLTTEPTRRRIAEVFQGAPIEARW